MKPRLAAILVLIVILPLGALAWFAARSIRDEQDAVRHRMSQLFADALHDAAAPIDQLIMHREQELQSLLAELSDEPEALRTATRTNPLIRQLFTLDTDGRLSFPTTAIRLSNTEEEFLERTRGVWTSIDLAGPLPETSANRQGKLSPSVRQGGWHAYQNVKGFGLLYWQRSPSGPVMGAELDVTRLVADIIGLLPQTDAKEPSPPDAIVALVDSSARMLYQWGGYQAARGESPRVSRPLAPPLASWQLQYFAPDSLFAPAGNRLYVGLWAGMGALALALSGLAFYFYHESTREIRLASQRVSFVNRVSHELKTPLTNIRMYAELLEQELPGEETDKPHSSLAVIVSESQRLSRLINNVLVFSRRQRKALTLHPKTGIVDDVIAGVIESFRLSFESRGLTAAFTPGAGARVAFDTDALGQILANLLSNAEKYAANGGTVRITSSQEGDTTTIIIADSGPGIPGGDRERVFEPFYRVSNKLTDGVAGTGIGLAISRELARLHGGDLRLTSSAGTGTTFELELRTPPVPDKETTP